MDITLAICTKARSELLRATLASIAAADAVDCRWHVLLVDNDPSGSAAAVAATFRPSLRIDYEREPIAGLSSVRNRAVAHAKGRWIIWIDDDVRVDRGLLTGYATAFRRWPDAAFFGGAVQPVFETPRPRWMAAVEHLLLPFYGHVTPGPEGTRIADPLGPLPIAANCAVRTDVQRKFPFDLKRGSRPGYLIIRGEESDVARRMIRVGVTGLWLPSARADHWVPRARQTTRELRQIMMGQGFAYGQGWGGRFESDLAAGGQVRPPLRMLVRRCLQSELQYGAARLGGDERRWVPALLDAALASGMLLGRLTRTGERRQPP